MKNKLTGVDFSNTLSKSQIEEMATVDEFEVVKEVQVSSVCFSDNHIIPRETEDREDMSLMPNLQEFFADYLVQYPSHFTLTQAALAEGGDGPPNVSLYLQCTLYR